MYGKDLAKKEVVLFWRVKWQSEPWKYNLKVATPVLVFAEQGWTRMGYAKA